VNSTYHCLGNLNFADNNNKFYVLAVESLYYFQIQSWTEKVDILIAESEWLEALAVVLMYNADNQIADYHNNDNTNTNVNGGNNGVNNGFNSDLNKRQSTRQINLKRGLITNDKSKSVDLYITRYVELAISQPMNFNKTNQTNSLFTNDSNNNSHHYNNSNNYSNNYGSNNNSRNHYHLVAGVCIEFCLAANRMHLLFTDIYQMFCYVHQEIIFFDAIEPFILTSAIKTLPTHIIQDYMEITKKTQKYTTFERCIVYLDFPFIDKLILQEIEVFLLEKELISGYIFIKNYYNNDFVDSFKILFEYMISYSDSNSYIKTTNTNNSMTTTDINYIDMNENFPSANQANITFKIFLFILYSADYKIFPRGNDIKELFNMYGHGYDIANTNNNSNEIINMSNLYLLVREILKHTHDNSHSNKNNNSKITTIV
jgi:hypothetical protein